jgi:hypothetical protein
MHSAMDRNDIQNNRGLETDATVPNRNRDDQRQQFAQRFGNRRVSAEREAQNLPEPQPRMQEGNGQGRAAGVPNGNAENQQQPNHEPVNGENEEAQNAQGQEPQFSIFEKCIEIVKKIVKIVKIFANYVKAANSFLTFMFVLVAGLFLACNKRLILLAAGTVIAICGVLTVTPDLGLSRETKCWCFLAEFLSSVIIGNSINRIFIFF